MKAVDLFSGCGGLSLGFEKAGIPVSAAFEWWDPAIDVYRENMKHPIFKQDLSKVEEAVKLIIPFQPQIIIGGPPCQDFSHAGKRTEGTQANLTVAFAEIITKVKPLWFVMENVDRAQKSVAFQEAKKLFKAAGYGLTMSTLDASLCGVPQKRKRFFCIGKLHEHDDFLLEALLTNQSSTPMTVRDRFGDKLGLEYYYRHPRNYSRRAVFSIDEPAPTVRGVNRPVPPGYTKHSGDPVSPEGLRSLTTEERGWLQTFPEDFKWLGAKTNKEQMIGNAVPVDLAKFVAGCIKAYETKSIVVRSDNRLKHDQNKFKEWLAQTQNLTPRSANDITSRVNRASRLTNIHMEDAIVEDILHNMGKNETFKTLSPTVKSQLKRAVFLYKSFTACATV